MDVAAWLRSLGLERGRNPSYAGLVAKPIACENHPLVLPAAHDALAARLIERTGFAAYQVGGFALVGARYAHPDVDLEHYAEKRIAFEQIIAASTLRC
jgi:2-methylisocitrate lyase-like PEP mutase family enzyme